MNLLNSGEQKVKSFWNRPEGKTGMLFMAGIAVAAYFGITAILPALLAFIIPLLENTLYAIGLGVICVVVVAFLASPNLWKALWYLYKIIMRKITGFIVEINPIEIIKVHIRTLRERREEMNEKLILVKGQQTKLDRTLQDNITKMQKAMNIANQAKNAGNQREVGLQMREHERWDGFNNRLTPLKKKLNDLYEFLYALYVNSDYIIRDMESEIAMKEIEYKAFKEGASAIKSAKSIFSGQGEDELYQQAADFLEEDMSNKIGEIDSFMRDTESIITSLNYENGALEEAGMKKLEAFKASDYTFLLNKDAGIVPNAPEKILIPIKTAVSGKASGIGNLLEED